MAVNPYGYFLVVVDSYTKYLQVVPLVNRKPPGIINAVRLLLRGPLPITTIFSDKEGSFLSRDFRAFLKAHEVGIYFTTVTSPPASGFKFSIQHFRRRQTPLMPRIKSE